MLDEKCEGCRNSVSIFFLCEPTFCLGNGCVSRILGLLRGIPTGERRLSFVDRFLVVERLLFNLKLACQLQRFTHMCEPSTSLGEGVSPALELGRDVR